MTYNILPLKLPGARALGHPLTRPFNIDADCVMALLPEINTKWLDYSNKTNHGTISGNPTIVPGRFGQALRFDGTGDFLTVSDHASIKFATGDFSFAVWLRTSDTVNCDIIEKGPGGSFYLYRMKSTGVMVIQIYDGVTSISKDGTIAVNDGAWHHCVTTVDRSDVMKHYIDGVYDNSSADVSGVGDISTVNNLLICDDSLSTHYYIGDIDEILIFNRVLEALEIKALFDMGKHP